MLMRIHLHALRSAGLAALGLAGGCLLAGALPAGASPQAPTADARAQLQTATAVRQQAENRLAQLQIRHTQLQARLADGSSRTSALAANMAAARKAARDRAVDAYV